MAKEVKAQKGEKKDSGRVSVTYLKDLGTNKKDETGEMDKSTANALAKHGAVKVGAAVEVKIIESNAVKAGK